MKRALRIFGIVFLLCLCVMMNVILTSCKGDDVTDPFNTSDSTEVSDGLVLFDGESYAAKLIYTTSSSADITSLRSRISKALENRCGVRPEMEKDEMSEPSAEAVEVLIGSTNREESLAIDGVEENDAWYYVGIIGNKLVINGSNGYMLELAVEYFIDSYLAQVEGSTLAFTADLTEKVIWADFCKEGWMLEELPYYDGQRMQYASSTYSAGKLLTDMDDGNIEEAEVMVVSKTTASEFEAYVERLVSFGYEQISTNKLEDNSYVSLTNGQNNVYTYYVAERHVVNVILDNRSATPEELSYSVTAEAGKGATFYMYGLNMDPYIYDGTGVAGYPNNGMLLVIKCADNSVIIVDGGAALQMTGIEGETDKPMQEFDEFLHEITGKRSDEKVTIACWYLTHMHGDHFYGFKEFITAYSAKYDLKTICTNIPFAQSELSVSDVGALAKLIGEEYPECKEIKVHTGQKLTFADVTLEALFTHEDGISLTTGKTTLAGNFNDTSTVMKISTADMSMLVLGDACTKAEEYLIKAYTEQTLKCDVVQISHHGFTEIEDLYELVQARIYLIPQSYGMQQRRIEEWEIIAKTSIDRVIENYADDGMVFYAGKAEYTVGLAVINGEISVVYAPSSLPEYDSDDVKPETTVVIIGKDDQDHWDDLDRVGRY